MANNEYKLEKLNDMYKKGKRADKQIFAEQRTNILLRSGDHYNKSNNTVMEDLRTRGVVSKKQKIRLTKNHIHRITNIYENSVLDGNPSITAVPYNEDELHDVKSAELNNAVIDWVKHTNSWPKRQATNVHDFINLGEVFGIIRFDYSKGEALAIDENGNELRAGEFVVDRAFGFDMKRDPNARTEEDNRWWIRETMVDLEDFKETAKSLNSGIDLSKIESNGKGTTRVFDANSCSYREVKDQIHVKEAFIKSSTKYPKGWYVMFIEDFVVTQGPIPFGIYPVIYGGFDEQTTSPRSTSIIKICRPYQKEINRAASKMAEHQVTLGDDRVYIQSGTSISEGGRLHGVRAFKVSGKEPVIQQGRNGAQYLDYQIQQIGEMYQAAGLDFVDQDKTPQSGDPYQLLFRSMKEKKRFVKYVEKYERFEIDLFNTILKLAKHYLGANHIIKIAGRSETINIPEFKRLDQNGFEIKVVPQSGDVETKFGKILSTVQTLQYASSQLTPDQIGGLVKNLPFGNDRSAFSMLTINEDNATNDILALDRGQFIPAEVSDDHKFMLKAFNHRKKKSDFKFLPPQIQELYEVRIKQHEILLNEQRQLINQEQMGLVPAGGFLTTVNASAFNPVSKRVERIKMPSEAIMWLWNKLQTQGVYAQQLQDLPDSARANLSVQNQASLQGPQAQIINNEPQAQ
jgi:hypothetical protein